MAESLMDTYTPERVLLERHRDMIRAAERRARLDSAGAGWPTRVWVAVRLRAIADRLERRPQLRLVDVSGERPQPG